MFDFDSIKDTVQGEAESAAAKVANKAFGGGFLGTLFGLGDSEYEGVVREKNKLYLKDSVHASNTFNLKTARPSFGWPKLTFQYYAEITLSHQFYSKLKNYRGALPGVDDLRIMIPMTKAVRMPTYQVSSEVLNQYNRKRVSQKKMTYSPMSLTFYDTIDNSAMRFCSTCYDFYFKDGLYDDYSKLEIDDDQYHPASSSDAAFKATGFRLDSEKLSKFRSQSGFSFKYLIEKIEIFQLFGGNAISQVTVINPIPTSISTPSLDYENGGQASQFSVSFEYERLSFSTQRDPNSNMLGKSDDIKDLMGNSKHFELPPPPGLAKKEEEGPTSWWDEIGDSLKDAAGEDTFMGTLASFGYQLHQGAEGIGLNLAEDVTGYVSQLPGEVAKAGVSAIFTGKFELDTNPGDVFKQIGENAVDNIKGEVISESKTFGMNIFNAASESVVEWWNEDQESQTSDESGKEKESKKEE